MPHDHESVTLAIAVSRETLCSEAKTEFRDTVVGDHAWLAQIARPTTFAPPCKGMLSFIRARTCDGVRVACFVVALALAPRGSAGRPCV
jgi:hypothetical protein